MAKLDALPSTAIVDTLAGCIDFYDYMGIHCARSWPRAYTGPYPHNQRAQWPIFAAASRVWNSLTPDVQAAYDKMAASTSLSGRDLAAKMYINANTIYHHEDTYDLF